jgi:hypothetical protein
MRRSVGLFLVGLLPVVVACNHAPRSVAIIEDGCLTASGSQFVLTALERAERHPSLSHERIIGTRPRPTTEAYMLIGDDEKLTNLVGTRVRVVGEADPMQVAEIHHMSPKVRIRRPGSSAVTPAVTDHEVLRLEVHRLRVTSVNPTGDDCTAEFQRAAPNSAVACERPPRVVNNVNGNVR